MRPTLSPLAEHDLESIGDYIAKDSPQRVLHAARDQSSIFGTDTAESDE